MRNAIRNALIDGVPEVEGRVFEPHAAAADTVKPYLVIKEGDDTQDVDWIGFRRPYEVWPYVDRTNFGDVDAIAKKVSAVLNEKLLTTDAGDAFTCIARGSSGDYHDEAWDAITRCVNFYVMALQPVDIPETVNDDPWIEAVSQWTSELLGSEYSVYKNRWPLGYKRPSVMWRLAEMNVTGQGMAIFDVRKKIVGHVLTRTSNEDIAIMTKIIEGLGNAIKIPLNRAERRYMTVSLPQVDFYADAMRTGQILLYLNRKTARPIEEVPLMAKVGIDGKVNEEGEDK